MLKFGYMQIRMYERYLCVDIQRHLNTFLAQGIPRDAFSTPRQYPVGFSYPASPGLRGTIRMGCGHRGPCFGRERDIIMCAGRLCAGTGINVHHGVAGLLVGFDCCVVHSAPSHISQET